MLLGLCCEHWSTAVAAVAATVTQRYRDESWDKSVYTSISGRLAAFTPTFFSKSTIRREVVCESG